MIPAWVVPLIEAGASIVKEWVIAYAAGNEAEQAAVEARAMTAISAMVGIRAATAAEHDARTAESKARIEGSK